jgi:MFS transporter, CP family, cyanate transporter
MSDVALARRLTPSTSPWPAVWVIAAGVSSAMHVGKVPVAIPLLREQLGLSLVQAGTLLSMSQLAGMLLAVFIGMLADGIGLRRSMLSGLLLMALASALGGAAPSVEVLLACRALEGMAFLLVVVPAPAMLRQLVTADRLAPTLGVWGTFMPAGTATALLAGPWVLAWGGWSVWWWVLAGASLLMSAAVYRGVPGPTTGSAHSGASVAWPQRLIQTWRNPGTWWVALAFGMYSSQWLVVIGFFPTLMQSAGMAAGAAGGVTAAASLVNIVGNIAGGQLLHRGVAVHKVLNTGFVAMVLGAVVIFGSGDAWPVWTKVAAALVFSGVGGVIPGSLFSLAVRVAPSEHTVSTSLGWTTQMSMVGQFVMPPVAAWLAQSHGNWSLTWLLNAAACALGLVLVWRLRVLLSGRGV